MQRRCIWQTRVGRMQISYPWRGSPSCVRLNVPSQLKANVFSSIDMKEMESQSTAMHDDVKQRVMHLREVQGGLRERRVEVTSSLCPPVPQPMPLLLFPRITNATGIRPQGNVKGAV